MPAERPTVLATSMGFNRAHDPWRPSPIFRYALDMAGSPPRPRLCFLTTETGDRRSSIDSFYAAFAGSSVDTSHLSLFEKPKCTHVTVHLREQDVIWVDRGSLLAVWRTHALDKVLRDCWRSGVVLGGESVRCSRSSTGWVSCRTRMPFIIASGVNSFTNESVPASYRTATRPTRAPACITRVPTWSPQSPIERTRVPTATMLRATAPAPG